MWVWMVAAALAVSPTVTLPPGTSPEPWRDALELAGVQLVTNGGSARLLDRGALWRLCVDRPEGEQCTDLAAPRTAEDREEIAWLIPAMAAELAFELPAPVPPALPPSPPTASKAPAEAMAAVAAPVAPPPAPPPAPVTARPAASAAPRPVDAAPPPPPDVPRAIADVPASPAEPPPPPPDVPRAVADVPASAAGPPPPEPTPPDASGPEPAVPAPPPPAVAPSPLRAESGLPETPRRRLQQIVSTGGRWQNQEGATLLVGGSLALGGPIWLVGLAAELDSPRSLTEDGSRRTWTASPELQGLWFPGRLGLGGALGLEHQRWWEDGTLVAAGWRPQVSARGLWCPGADGQLCASLAVGQSLRPVQEYEGARALEGAAPIHASAGIALRRIQEGSGG